MREFPKVKERDAGKIPSTAVTNELARAVLAMAPMILNGQVRQGLLGFDFFIGVITDTGPNLDEDDYTDERYWVHRAIVDGVDSETLAVADSTTHVTTTSWNEGDDKFIVTATNLMEGSLDKEIGGLANYQSGTHLLPIGTRVVCFSVDDTANEQNTRYFIFPICPLRTVAVLITGNAVGGGVYTAKMISDCSSDFLPAENADDESLGDIPDENNCFAVNMAESGQTTHDLTEGSPISSVFIGVIRARKSIKCDATGNANPSGTQKHVVVFNGYDFANCTSSSATLLI